MSLNKAGKGFGKIVKSKGAKMAMLCTMMFNGALVGCANQAPTMPSAMQQMQSKLPGHLHNYVQVGNTYTAVTSRTIKGVLTYFLTDIEQDKATGKLKFLDTKETTPDDPVVKKALESEAAGVTSSGGSEGVWDVPDGNIDHSNEQVSMWNQDGYQPMKDHVGPDGKMTNTNYIGDNKSIYVIPDKKLGIYYHLERKFTSSNNDKKEGIQMLVKHTLDKNKQWHSDYAFSLKMPYTKDGSTDQIKVYIDGVEVPYGAVKNEHQTAEVFLPAKRLALKDGNKTEYTVSFKNRTGGTIGDYKFTTSKSSTL